MPKPDSPTTPASRTVVVAAQIQPGVEAAAAVGSPVPAGAEAAVALSPIPAGNTTYLTETVKTGAAAQGLAGRIEATERVAERASRETPAAFDETIASVARLRALADGAADVAASVQRTLKVSLDRTRGVVRKVIAIYILLALGEVMLNTSAAVDLGEPLEVAVISFLGLSAASVAVGWVVGSTAKDMADRLLRGPCPPQAQGTGMESMFRPEGRWYRAATPDLVGWTAVLLALAWTTGALVGDMRAQADMSGAWGPVAAVIVLTAAAPPYLLRNRASDLIDAANARLDAYTTRIETKVPTADRHTAAQQSTLAALAEVPDAYLSQRLAALAGGYGQLATQQTHVLGHTLPAAEAPVAIAPVTVPSAVAESAPWISGDETDYARLRRARAGTNEHATEVPAMPEVVVVGERVHRAHPNGHDQGGAPLSGVHGMI